MNICGSSWLLQIIVHIGPPGHDALSQTPVEVPFVLGSLLLMADMPVQNTAPYLQKEANK